MCEGGSRQSEGKTLSSYENYDEAATHYDTSRIAVGVEIILGHLVTGRADLADTQLLDAGCGTGNYAAAIGPRIGSITLMDASEGMLAVATDKLASIAGAQVADSRVGQLQSLPFDDHSFDAVMTNQVLHHLGDPAGGEWPEHANAFAEYARVLRPGGALIINSCSQEQVKHGYWAFSLIPEARDKLAGQYAPLSIIEEQMRTNDLQPSGRFVPTDATIQGAAYFDPEGPLSSQWRRADSTWSLASEAETATMLDKVEGLKQRGELEAYRDEHDARRPAIGQTTFVASRLT